MKIYTKTGDSGTTSLFAGGRVDKSSSRIEANGLADELNSFIGVVISEDEKSKTRTKLLRIQRELFVLGSDLATPLDVKAKVPRIKKSYTTRLEREIDKWENDLPTLKNFILPGGSKIGAILHLARARCRCLERIVVSLDRSDSLNRQVLPYVNRLSDWFFVLARHTNLESDHEETLWRGRS